MDKTLIYQKTEEYLKIVLQYYLDWNENTLETRLKTAIDLLSKIRHYVSQALLRAWYFRLFKSHIDSCLPNLGLNSTVYPVDDLYFSNKFWKQLNNFYLILSPLRWLAWFKFLKCHILLIEMQSVEKNSYWQQYLKKILSSSFSPWEYFLKKSLVMFCFNS